MGNEGFIHGRQEFLTFYLMMAARKGSLLSLGGVYGVCTKKLHWR